VISANGGNYGTSTVGGGGGGGRVAIYYCNGPFAFPESNINVSGGIGFQNGGVGTTHLLLSPQSCNGCADRMRGDVTGDGHINGLDIHFFVAILLDTNAGSPGDRCAADVNMDGVVTTNDATELVAILLES
jgi:hypothetical protein